MTGTEIGISIASIFGCVWAAAGSSSLPPRWRAVTIPAAVTVAACLIAAAGRAPKQDLRFNGAPYGIAVTLEVAAIVIAAIGLSRIGKQSLIPPAVVVIVGLHFIGLWKATADELFAWLTLALCAVGAVGAVAPPSIRLAICGFGSALALWIASAWSIFT